MTLFALKLEQTKLNDYHYEWWLKLWKIVVQLQNIKVRKISVIDENWKTFINHNRCKTVISFVVTSEECMQCI